MEGMKYKIRNAYESFKKTISQVKSEDNWNNAPYLQGLIYSFDTRMKELSEENEQLRNREGVWLSEEDIRNHNRQVDKLKITVENHIDHTPE